VRAGKVGWRRFDATYWLQDAGEGIGAKTLRGAHVAKNSIHPLPTTALHDRHEIGTTLSGSSRHAGTQRVTSIEPGIPANEPHSTLHNGSNTRATQTLTKKSTARTDSP